MGAGNLIKALLEGHVQKTGVDTLGPGWQEKREAARIANLTGQANLANRPTPDQASRMTEATIGATEALGAGRQATAAGVGERTAIARAKLDLDRAKAIYDQDPSNPKSIALYTQAQFNMAKANLADVQADAGGFRPPDPNGGGSGSTQWAPAMVNGKLVYVDKRTRQPIEGVTPPPTAEMRNTDYQAQALEPAFQSLKQGLGILKQTTSGMAGNIPAAIPGTDAYWAKDAFISKAKAFAGAITARMAGEGSRLSDEDRVAYSRASAIVDNMILLPGGLEEAERRLTEVETLLQTIQARRNRAAGGFDVSGGMGVGGGAPPPPPSGGAPPPPPAPTARKRATNPQTGEVLELVNGQWIPAK